MDTQDWPDAQTARIAQALRRLRKDQGRSAQWVANRTKELGYEVTRTAIADVEIGRRKHVTIAELTVLARALNTSPTALMFPGPYDGMVEVLPGLEVAEIRAAQWFSGLLSEPTDVHILVDNRGQYSKNLKRLRLAREVWDLEESGIALRARMMKAGQSDDEKAQLVDALADLQRRIDRLTDELKAEDDGG